MSVLVVITRPEEAQSFINWGQFFAEARGEDLAVLCPLPAKEDLKTTSLKLSEQSEVPVLETIRRIVVDLDKQPDIRVLRGKKHLTSILEEVKQLSGTLLVIGQNELHEDLKDDVSLQGDLLKRAPCEVLLLRPFQDDMHKCKHVLVPTDGEDEHTKNALRLCEKLADHDHCKVDLLYVFIPSTETDEEMEFDEEHPEVIKAKEALQRVMSSTRLAEHEAFSTTYIGAKSIAEGILHACKSEEYDLILLGASKLNYIRRTLFGSLTERLWKDEKATSIAVIQAAAPVVVRAKVQMHSFLDRFVPQMERAERVELFERLDRGARAEFNFITLICLSTAIAALGLIQNSGAVVIGAMLVAPLMTPMLAAGLGIVQGNIVLFRTSLHSVAVGFLCSLIVGYVFGKVAFPLYSLTPELAARGGPNVLDLIVALLSGVAAAYAMGRPGLLEALPGVAIAAALVPPIATVGISISIGEYGNALGAAMLFGTNLIAIILASAIALYALGIRPRLDEEKSRPWARHILLILSVSVMAIAIPLWGPLAHSEMMENGRVQKELGVYLSSQSVLVRRVFQNRKNGAQDVYVELIHQKPIPPRIYAGMRKTIRSIVGASADLKVISLKMWEPPVIRNAKPLTVPVNKRPTTRRVQPTSRPTP